MCVWSDCVIHSKFISFPRLSITPLFPYNRTDFCHVEDTLLLPICPQEYKPGLTFCLLIDQYILDSPLRKLVLIVIYQKYSGIDISV
jgi:hypothetical protein